MSGQDLEKWVALATKELKDKPLAGLTWATPEGFDVKPLYTAADLEGIEAADSLPGLAPFLRGVRATMYAGRPWTDPAICRLLDRRGVQRLLPEQSGRRADGPFGGLRSRDPPRL